MKLAVGIMFCICAFAAVAPAQDPQEPVIRDVFKFDEWGDLRFADEKVRLDNIASVMIGRNPENIVYLIIHAGQTACVDEAKARGIRAKNYLVSRGISEDRIVWIDAGWRKEVWIVVWLLSADMGKPGAMLDGALKREEVKLQKGCKIKYRGH